MSTVALVDNPRKRRAKKRSTKKSSRRRTPPRYKSGPNKGKFKPRGGSRKRTAKKRTTKRSYSGGRKTYIKSGPRKGQRRGKYVMKTAKRKAASGRTVTVRKRYYKNPGSSFVLMNPRRRKGKILEGIAQMAGLSAVAFGGALLTRKLPRVVLKEHDTGWKGYLANAGLAIGAGLATAWVTKMPDVGAAVALGGGVATLIRIANEKTAPDSPVHVGKGTLGRAEYVRRQLGRARYYRRTVGAPHDSDKGWRRNKKGSLAGSRAQRPASFGRRRPTNYYPARTGQLGHAFRSNFATQVGRAEYVPAHSY